MSKVSILLAEDNPNTRWLLHYALERKGFEVTEAENGAAALALLEQRHPDLLLTDLMMPQVDGLELIRRVRAQDEFADLPIVVMSGETDEHLANASATGALATFPKPLDVNDLVETINRLLLDHPAKTWH